MNEPKRPIKTKELIDNTPTAWSLARLHRGIPIVGVLAQPRRGDGVVFDCCSLGGLMGF